MKDEIKSINMNGKLNHEEIYNLFKTRSLKINKEISEKIDSFKYNIDFFEFYSKRDIKNLLNIFELKLSENNDEIFSSFKSDTERYISCISQIILSIKLFLKIYDILKKVITNAKNYLLKLNYGNELENCNQDYLFLYLDSLIKISEKNLKLNNSNASTLLSSKISSFEDTPIYSNLPKYSTKQQIECFSIDEKKSTIYDNLSTPKFGSISDEFIKNQEKKDSNLENSNGYNFPRQKDSVLTFSKYVFAEEAFISQNFESNLIVSPIVKSKKNKASNKRRIPQSENIDKRKNKIKIPYQTDFIIKNNNIKNHYKNLLEMINKMYKKELINSKEKIKLKQLVIEKSKKIDYLYYNIYLNSKNGKNMLITEVKKIVD